MCGTLHMQRYDQLHAEETATQRVKGQCDDPEESAMDRGRERPMWTHSPTDAAILSWPYITAQSSRKKNW